MALIKNLKINKKRTQEEELKIWKEDFTKAYNNISHEVEKTSNRLVVSNCCKNKERIDDVPAGELYKSPGIRKIYSGMDKLDYDYIILSGMYGLISSRTKINYYDDNIMELNEKSLSIIKPIIRYEEDLIDLINKNNYTEVFLLLSAHWMSLLNLSNIVEKTSSNIVYKCFISQGKLDNNYFIPKEFEPVIVGLNQCDVFKAPIINLRYMITYAYLEEKLENESLNAFIDRKLNVSN